jgi:arginine-tRNA-protein transferase
MYTRMIHPEALSSEELDAFLAQGWFRMRQAMFTCRFVMSDGFLRTAVWARFPLDGYHFKKSLRRVLRRNDERFDVQLRPATIDPEKESLYAVYRDDFAGDLAPDLKSVLYDDGEHDIYPTMCLEVRDDEKLIACSFFDVGVDSMASIIGIYDPQYRRYGLGMYTMLAEMRLGISEGLSWYYPGYVAPGCAAFDYKLRLGSSEFFDPNLIQWRPYAELQTPLLPAVRITAALEALCVEARSKGHSVETWLYPPYGVVGMDRRGEGFLTEPAFVQFDDATTGAGRLLITYDVVQECYVIELFARIRDLRRHFGGVDHPRAGPRQCHDLLRRVRRVGSASSVEDALFLAMGPRGRSTPPTAPPQQ